MKTSFCTLLLMIICFASYGQNIGINTLTPAVSAALDVASSSRGLLVPRMTTGGRTGILAPATGLLVYDSTLKSFYTYNGTIWTPVTTTDAAALTSGILPDARHSTNVTMQGNTFNTANSLVQLNAAGALPALNAASLTSLNAGNISSGTVGIGNGGTGQTTAASALTALLPTQSGNAGKVLTTNGTAASWGAATNSTAFTTTISYANSGTEVANTLYYFNPTSAYTGTGSAFVTAQHANIAAQGTPANFMTIMNPCTLVALRLCVDNYAVSTSTTTTVTIYVNGGATTMTTAVTTAGTIACSSDVTHIQSLNTGDRVSIGWKDNANAGYNMNTVQLVFQ